MVRILILSLQLLAIAVFQITSSYAIEVLHYDFDGDVVDTTGRGNDGTIVGSPTFVAADTNQGILFDNPVGQVSSTQFVRAPFSPDIQNLQSASMTVGIKYRSTDDAETNGRLAGTNPDLQFVYNAGNEPTAAVAVHGVIVRDTSNPVSVTTDGDWHWQFAVIDRGTNVLDGYIDTTLIDSVSIPNTPIVLDELLIGAIGNTTTFGARMTTVDEFIVWDSALTADEIRRVVVPEPSSLLLLGMGGLVVLGSIFRCQRKK